jgi:hypothetical protein
MNPLFSWGPVFGSKPFRLLALVITWALSVYLWSINAEKPAQNRKHYSQARLYDKRIAAMKGLLEGLRECGDRNPRCKDILERQHVDELINFPMKREESSNGKLSD